jgi:hypothetical protein
MTIQSKPQYEIKVYKIWFGDAPDDYYIGSTKQDRLSKRMKKHRDDARGGNNSKLYKLMREKRYDFKYIQISSCMVSCFDEQRMFEQQWMDTLKPTLNTIRAYISLKHTKQNKKEYKQRPETKQQQKEYYQKPEIKQMTKEYYQKPEQKKKHKDYISDAKRTCVCGGLYYDIPCRKKIHLNTKLHQNYVNAT